MRRARATGPGAPRLTGRWPEPRDSVTSFDQDDYIFGALRAGASGFLLKRTRPEELVAAVHTLARGDSLLSPSVTRCVIDRIAQQPTPEPRRSAKLRELTAREREVLALVARGLPNREIAHHGANREELVAGAGAVSARDRAVDPGGLEGDPAAPLHAPARAVLRVTL